MTQHFALPDEWVAAIHEDALTSDSNIARMRAGILHKISGVRRVTVRVGRTYPGTIPPPGFGFHIDGSTDYLRRTPVCQACGLRITHGDKAIRYRFHRTLPSLGRIRYVHMDCPKENP